MSNRLYTKKHRSGVIDTFVRLQPGERAIIVRDERYYRLGGQVDSVVAGHVLNVAEVAWCSTAQEWTYAGDPVVEVKP